MYISTPKVAILWECFCIAIKCANGDGDFWHILITKKIIKNKFVNVPKISVPIGTLLNNKGGETMVKVELKDGSEIEVNEGASVLEVAKKISEGLARNAMAARIDGEVKDLRTLIEKDCKLEILTFDDLDGKKAYWHTTSHIMAQAIKRLYGDNAKLTIGPSIDNGFYYDFDVEKPFTEEDLAKIEEEMKKIVKEDLPITRYTLSREEAIKLMKDRKEPYKVELIEELPEDEEISFYDQGEFKELCAGPHIMSTGPVKAFKLLHSSASYWRGDETKQTLQRIYGIAFPKASMLE